MERAQQYLAPTRDATPATAAGTLYLWGISPFGYKVRMAAAHKGARLDVRIASLPDCLSARRNTGMRKTPFLVAGDRWITDSTAICAWLETLPGPSLLPRDAATCLLLEDWADEGLNRAAEPWIWVAGGGVSKLARMCAEEQTHGPSGWAFRLMTPYMRRLWTSRAAVHGGPEGARALLCAQLDLIERRLDGRPWLFGDAPTVADFAVAGQLANLVRFGCSDDLDRRSATSAMVRRAVAVLSW